MKKKFNIEFDFDVEKGKAMLDYLLNQVGGQYNYMALLKLVFFADRYHVRKYARPVSSDIYFALKLGPLPSNLCTVSKMIYNPIDNNFTAVRENGKIDMDRFSLSDIEAMNFAVQHFSPLGRRSQYILAYITHAYPEWNKYKKRFDANDRGRENMYYEDFLLNANPNHTEFIKYRFKDPFPPITPAVREMILDEMVERSAMML